MTIRQCKKPPSSGFRILSGGDGQGVYRVEAG